MSSQGLLTEIKKHLPFRVYGKGPVLELFKAGGHFVNKKTELEATEVFRSDESGELVCTVVFDGKEKISAALTNLKLDISHPLFNKVRNYRREVEVELSQQEAPDVNRASFRIKDLYKK